MRFPKLYHMPVRVEKPKNPLAPRLFSNCVNEDHILRNARKGFVEIGFLEIQDQVSSSIRKRACVFDAKDISEKSSAIMHGEAIGKFHEVSAIFQDRET